MCIYGVALSERHAEACQLQANIGNDAALRCVPLDDIFVRGCLTQPQRPTQKQMGSVHVAGDIEERNKENAKASSGIYKKIFTNKRDCHLVGAQWCVDGRQSEAGMRRCINDNDCCCCLLLLFVTHAHIYTPYTPTQLRFTHTTATEQCRYSN